MEEELSKKIDEITSEIASLGDTLSSFRNDFNNAAENLIRTIAELKETFYRN